MSDDDVLEVVRTSATWTEVEDRLSDWTSCQAWWEAIAWPGLLSMTALCRTPARERLAMWRKAKRRGELHYYLRG